MILLKSEPLAWTRGCLWAVLFLDGLQTKNGFYIFKKSLKKKKKGYAETPFGPTDLKYTLLAFYRVCQPMAYIIADLSPNRMDFMILISLCWVIADTWFPFRPMELGFFFCLSKILGFQNFYG